MAVPQKRTSKRVRNSRRSHQALKLPTLVSCGNCGEKIRPHRVCSKCGYFKGEEILKVESY